MRRKVKKEKMHKKNLIKRAEILKNVFEGLIYFMKNLKLSNLHPDVEEAIEAVTPEECCITLTRFVPADREIIVNAVWKVGQAPGGGCRGLAQKVRQALRLMEKNATTLLEKARFAPLQSFVWTWLDEEEETGATSLKRGLCSLSRLPARYK